MPLPWSIRAGGANLGAMDQGFSGVERSEQSCAGCARPLVELPEPLFATLAPEGDGWRRRDYCAACFEALPARPFSFWKRTKTAVAAGSGGPTKDERRERRRRDLDALLELFERLASPESAEKAPEAA